MTKYLLVSAVSLSLGVFGYIVLGPKERAKVKRLE